MPGNVQKIHREVAHKIDFSTAAAKKRQFDDSVGGVKMPGIRTHAGTVHPCKHSPTLLDLQPLLAILNSDTKAVCLSGMEDYYEQDVDPVQPQMQPKSLLCLRDTSKEDCELSVLKQHCEGLVPMTAASESQAALIEGKTRLQHLCKSWYSLRAGRITASNIHVVISSNLSTSAISTINRVCHPQKKAHTPATKWGVDHEDTARQVYLCNVGPKHINFRVQQCGFIINPSFAEVGASPDGLIDCSCCGKGSLEIKCPILYRNESIQQACKEDRQFCLSLTDGIVALKHGHPYYSQIQTQIHVTKSEYCDLVVWTLKDFVVVGLFPDHTHWRNILVKAQNFFQKVCLPELVACYFTKAHSAAHEQQPLKDITQVLNTNTRKKRKRETAAKVWCLCQGPESLDDMVACDNENCKIQWFHYRCVGLRKAPSTSEEWFCPDCKHS
ncbi:uncharacterized protein LOC127537003 [Acanthochromis polyacanthus]|uniref:uncharacterized protein LOC127537003 n=1 Tax=Acanthochromis polyacanthus TaxID=80966 RepID=UPI0022343344|nr:uncharacterized protein LOC127537003 [Acanthochromis polyacanthus]XP_051814465.1 uncharacterized protein LOC127537003 [Acanthochromis polyacanthus]